VISKVQGLMIGSDFDKLLSANGAGKTPFVVSLSNHNGATD
jgi:hypothetical protein